MWKPFDPRFVFFFSLRDDLLSALSSSSPAVVKVNVNPGLVNVKRDFPKTEKKCIQVVHNKSKYKDSKYHLVKNSQWLRPLYRRNLPVIPVIVIPLGCYYKFEQSPLFCGHKSFEYLDDFTIQVLLYLI